MAGEESLVCPLKESEEREKTRLRSSTVPKLEDFAQLREITPTEKELNDGIKSIFALRMTSPGGGSLTQENYFFRENNELVQVTRYTRESGKSEREVYAASPELQKIAASILRELLKEEE